MVGGAVAPLVVGRASTDPRFAEHPGLARYGIESYIAVPLMRRDGAYFGTLCALDSQPAELSEDDLAVFRLMADLIAFELEADEEQQRREDELAEERRAAALRERFIGTLGHDLRTPITAIMGFATRLMRRPDLPAAAASDLGWITSSAERMNRMVSDLLDFTRGRLGGGIPVVPEATELRVVCKQVVAELRASHPERTIELRTEGDTRGRWDPERIGRVLANLLSNALRYGAPERPVEVALCGAGEQVVLEVRNQGQPIAAEMLGNIFDPFRRGAPPEDGEERGLGLGLYIVAEIVRAHGGEVTVTSSAEKGTTFAVRLPRDGRGHGGAGR